MLLNFLGLNGSIEPVVELIFLAALFGAGTSCSLVYGLYQSMCLLIALQAILYLREEVVYIYWRDSNILFFLKAESKRYMMNMTGLPDEALHGIFDNYYKTVDNPPRSFPARQALKMAREWKECFEFYTERYVNMLVVEGRLMSPDMAAIYKEEVRANLRHFPGVKILRLNDGNRICDSMLTSDGLNDETQRRLTCPSMFWDQIEAYNSLPLEELIMEGSSPERAQRIDTLEILATVNYQWVDSFKSLACFDDNYELFELYLREKCLTWLRMFPSVKQLKGDFSLLNMLENDDIFDSIFSCLPNLTELDLSDKWLGMANGSDVASESLDWWNLSLFSEKLIRLKLSFRNIDLEDLDHGLSTLQALDVLELDNVRFISQEILNSVPEHLELNFVSGNAELEAAFKNSGSLPPCETWSNHMVYLLFRRR